MDRLDRETAPAVEGWLEEHIRGVRSTLLDEPTAAVTQMMMMCSPVRDHGPAQWHRDLHPIDTAPLQGYIDDIVEAGPRYVQWNIPLYDDSVLWVVPGSHLRFNTPEENAVMGADPCQPVPSGVQTHLEAGDGVVYILPILHWGSNYSPLLRRTAHGGFSTHTGIDDLSFIQHLSQQAADTFEGFVEQSNDMRQHTESALRAVIAGNGRAYTEALDGLHRQRGEKGRILSTVFLCKTALSIRLYKEPPFPEIPEDLDRRIRGAHPITLNWGSEFGDRFTASEAEALWERFAPLDTLLRTAEEQFVPGFQSDPMSYHFNDMPSNYATSDFIASWY